MYAHTWTISYEYGTSTNATSQDSDEPAKLCSLSDYSLPQIQEVHK